MNEYYTCLLCGRSKFTRPGQPHKCNGQKRKHFRKAARLAGLENAFAKTGEAKP